MAGSIGRSISIGLKADTKDFKKGIKGAEGTMDKFKKSAQVAGAAIGGAFVAAGTFAIKFGMDSLNAAIEDEKGQRKLAQTIKNNTTVRKGLNAAAEKTISKLESEFNVVDDKLRPAMGKLIVATKSVNKSQKLMRLALDISAGTGKDLSVVTDALAKAYLGNNGALSKLGIGIDKNKLKHMSFQKITETLSKTMGGQATKAAGSFSGAMDGLKIAWSNFQESVGYKIMPYVKKALKFVKDELLPWLGHVRDGFKGAGGDKKSPAYQLGVTFKNMATALGTLFKQFGDKKIAGKATQLDGLAVSLSNMAESITTLTKSISDMVNMSNWDRFKWLITQDFKKGSIFTLGKYIIDWGKGVNKRYDENKGRATGGAVIRNQSYIVGERGPELFTPSGSGHISTNRQTMGGGGTTIINLNGIVDADSARKAIEQVLRNSGKRIGPVNLVGNTL